MRSILAFVLLSVPLFAAGQVSTEQSEPEYGTIAPYGPDRDLDSAEGQSLQDRNTSPRKHKTNPELPKIMDSYIPDENEPARKNESPEKKKSPEKKSPGLFEVDEEAATRALERSLIQINALLLAPGHVEMGFGIASAQDEQSVPILLQGIDNESLFAGLAKQRTETASSQFEVQLGLPFDSEVDVSVPYHSVHITNSASIVGEVIEERNDTSSGVGDVRVTVLKTVVKERDYWPDIIALVTFDADTAEDRIPVLGSGASETTLALNATKRQDPLVFIFGLSHTQEVRNETFRTGARSSFTAGTVLAASPRTSLRFLVTQSHIGESTRDGQLLDAGQGSSALLNLGVSSVISRNVFVTAGVSAALTSNATDYVFNLAVSRRFDFFNW